MDPEMKTTADKACVTVSWLQLSAGLINEPVKQLFSFIATVSQDDWNAFIAQMFREITAIVAQLQLICYDATGKQTQVRFICKLYLNKVIYNVHNRQLDDSQTSMAHPQFYSVKLLLTCFSVGTKKKKKQSLYIQSSCSWIGKQIGSWL